MCFALTSGLPGCGTCPLNQGSLGKPGQSGLPAGGLVSVLVRAPTGLQSWGHWPLPPSPLHLASMVPDGAKCFPRTLLYVTLLARGDKHRPMLQTRKQDPGGSCLEHGPVRAETGPLCWTKSGALLLKASWERSGRRQGRKQCCVLQKSGRCRAHTGRPGESLRRNARGEEQ